MPRLIKSSAKYKKSFLRNFVSHKMIGETSWEKFFPDKKSLDKNFSGFVKFVRKQEKGQNLPKGYVPQTTFWLVDGNQFLGITTIRHTLTPELKKVGGHIGYEVAKKQRGKGYGNLILKLGLKKAKILGIKKVLLTCDATNTRSKKVIEANGGKSASRTKQGKGLPGKLRYWIKIS